MVDPKNTIGIESVIEIEPEKLARMQAMRVPLVLLDLRSAVDFQSGHIRGAFNLPVEDFLARLPQMVSMKQMPVVIYDVQGEKASSLAIEAEKLGYINVVCLQGGYEAFMKYKKEIVG